MAQVTQDRGAGWYVTGQAPKVNPGSNSTYIGGLGGRTGSPNNGTWNPMSGLINSVNAGLAKLPQQQQPYTGTGSGYGGGGSGAVGQQSLVSPVQSIWDALMAQRQQAIAAANAALDEQASLARARYRSSRKQISRNYQDLRNQHSVNNFKAGKAQREALADRGALGSGPGLQERLSLSANYNNGLNKINTQEQSAFEELLNNLNQYLAQIDLQKAANLQTGMDNWMNLISQIGNFAGYAPSEAYNQLAQSLAGQQQVASPVATAATGAAGLTNDDYYNTLLRQYGAR